MYVDRKKKKLFSFHPPNLNYQSQELTLQDVKVSGENKEGFIKLVFGPFL